MRIAMIVPGIVPRPPARLAPPRMIPVIASRSRPWAVVGEVAPSCETTMRAASADHEARQQEPDDDIAFQGDPGQEGRLRVGAHRVHVPTVTRLAHDEPEQREYGQQDEDADRNLDAEEIDAAAAEDIETLDRDVAPGADELG